jgi:hypothetical protein
VSTAWEDLKGLMRVAFAFRRGKGRLDSASSKRLPLDLGTASFGADQ